MSPMLDGCKSLTNVDLSNLNTKNVTDMRYMFCYCYLIKIIHLFYIYLSKNWEI